MGPADGAGPDEPRALDGLFLDVGIDGARPSAFGEDFRRRRNAFSIVIRQCLAEPKSRKRALCRANAVVAGDREKICVRPPSYPGVWGRGRGGPSQTPTLQRSE